MRPENKKGICLHIRKPFRHQSYRTSFPHLILVATTNCRHSPSQGNDSAEVRVVFCEAVSFSGAASESDSKVLKDLQWSRKYHELFFLFWECLLAQKKLGAIAVLVKKFANFVCNICSSAQPLGVTLVPLFWVASFMILHFWRMEWNFCMQWLLRR